MATDFGEHAKHVRNEVFRAGCIFCEENLTVHDRLLQEEESRERAEELPDLHEKCVTQQYLSQQLRKTEDIAFAAGSVEGRNALQDEIHGLLLVEAQPRKTFDSLDEANEFLAELHKLLKEKR